MNASHSTMVFTANEQRAIQRLKECAAVIPYYQNLKLNELNNCNSLKNLLSHFPILQKEDLLLLDDKLYELPASMISIMSETSGTTNNKPLLTPRSQEELRWNSRNQAYAYSQHLTAGIDSVAILHPTIMSPFAEATAIALQSLGISYLRVYPIPNLCDYEKIIRILCDYKITTIMTTPTLAAKLLYEKDKLLHFPRWSVNKLLLTGECISKAMQNNFDKLMDVKGATQLFVYGSSESATCMYGNSSGSYYGFLQDFIFEVLPSNDTDISKITNEVEGTLLITWLNHGIRPLIRYNSQDKARVKIDKYHSHHEFYITGRENLPALSTDQLLHLEEMIYHNFDKVYFFDLNISPTEIISNIITSSPEQVSKTQQCQLKELLSKLNGLQTGAKVKICFNPPDHKFFEFSPRTKASQIIVR